MQDPNNPTELERESNVEREIGEIMEKREKRERERKLLSNQGRGRKRVAIGGA